MKKRKAKGKEYSSIVVESAFGGNRDVGDVYVHGPLSGTDGGISHFCGGLNWANQCIQSAGAKGWMLESTRSQEPNRRKVIWLMVESTLDSNHSKITWVLSRCL